MSLLRTLATVAVGMATAGAANGLMNRGDRDEVRGGDGLLDALDRQSDDRGLGELLGGGGSRSGGGLGDLLENVGGLGAAGGLAGLLGPAAGAQAIGRLLGGRDDGDGEPAFGRRLNEALRTGREPLSRPTRDEEALAGLLIRVMIMAAKSDGRIDRNEREALLGRLGDLDREERRFVEDALDDPVDLRDFARDVPRNAGLRRQIYAAAVSAIDVDSRAERNFLEDLADALDVDADNRGAVQKKVSARYAAPPQYESWRQAKMRGAVPGGHGGMPHGKSMPRKG